MLIRSVVHSFNIQKPFYLFGRFLPNGLTNGHGMEWNRTERNGFTSERFFYPAIQILFIDKQYKIKKQLLFKTV